MKTKFKVIRIQAKETYSWLLNKHYAKRIPSISYAFGLYEDRILVGICTIGKPANPFLCSGIAGEQWKHIVFELNRLCVDSGEYNITSWFVSRCLGYFKDTKVIVSYADTQWKHIGKIYQACNFFFTGITKERTDIFVEGNKHARHYKKGGDYSQNRRYRSAKYRYVFITGDKRGKKKFLRDMKYPILPYPKGESQRYQADYKPSVQEILF